MVKNLIFGEESRAKVLEGVTTIARAVKSTLGPAGRNVVIEKPYASPVITKDGVTVAKEIQLKDQFANIGAQLVKEVSSKTNDIVGDGTTSSVVLAEAIFKEGLKNVAAGANPVYLARGIKDAAEVLAEELGEISVPVNSSESIKSVATVSANWDYDIGDIISKAMQEVGTDGTITVEEGNSTDTTLQVTSGMQFDRGYLSPLFLTDDNSTEVVLEDPYILFMDKKLTTLRSCVNLLQAVQQTQRPLLVIAESVEGEALSTMVINHMRGVLRCCAVMAPGFGDRRKAMLKDMAIMTDGTYFAEELGIDLNSVTPDDLGTARKVIITKDTTTIIDGSGVESDIEDRVAHIRNEIEKATSEYDKEKLQERLARLRGGIAVIRVGATTETEMKEKKDRIDDALHAARAAVEEGIVPGGGTALLKVRKSINRVIFANGVHADYLTGRQIVFEAVSATIKQIVANAGGNAELIAAKVEEEPNPHIGYNVVTSSYQNMIEAGVVDPTKVVRTSLLNAASIAGLMLTTECVITEDKSHKESPMPSMTMGM